MRARQDIIDKLRLETGERRKLCQELATRLEQSDLYRQRETVKKFADEHKSDPKAVAIVKEYMPELAPAATPEVRQRHADKHESPPLAAGLPERLKQADRYVESTPTDNQMQMPTM